MNSVTVQKKFYNKASTSYLHYLHALSCFFVHVRTLFSSDVKVQWYAIRIGNSGFEFNIKHARWALSTYKWCKTPNELAWIRTQLFLIEMWLNIQPALIQQTIAITPALSEEDFQSLRRVRLYRLYHTHHTLLWPVASVPGISREIAQMIAGDCGVPPLMAWKQWL